MKISSLCALLLAGSALALAGCGLSDARRISAMNADEIRGVSDYKLCNIYIEGRVAQEERRRRSLQCTNSADNPAANQWLIDRYERQQQQQYPRPQTTTCRNVGGVLQCTTI